MNIISKANLTEILTLSLNSFLKPPLQLIINSPFFFFFSIFFLSIITIKELSVFHKIDKAYDDKNY